MSKIKKEKPKVEAGFETKKQSTKLLSVKYPIDVSLKSIADSLKKLTKQKCRN